MFAQGVYVQSDSSINPYGLLDGCINVFVAKYTILWLFVEQNAELTFIIYCVPSIYPPKVK